MVEENMTEGKRSREGEVRMKAKGEEAPREWDGPRERKE
jgi:hypothetical protein